jgi:hypothetical protein
MHAAYTLSQLCYGCRADWMAELLNRIRSVWPNCSRDLQYVLCSITNRNETVAATAAVAGAQGTTQSRQRSRSPVRRSSDHAEPAPARRTHYEPSPRRSHSYSSSYSSSRSRSRSRAWHYRKRSESQEQQQHRRCRSLSTDSEGRSRSSSRDRRREHRRQRSVSVSARHGSYSCHRRRSSSSVCSVASNAVPAIARQWSHSDVHHAADDDPAVAAAIARLS